MRVKARSTTFYRLKVRAERIPRIPLIWVYRVTSICPLFTSNCCYFLTNKDVNLSSWCILSQGEARNLYIHFKTRIPRTVKRTLPGYLPTGSIDPKHLSSYLEKSVDDIYNSFLVSLYFTVRWGSGAKTIFFNIMRLKKSDIVSWAWALLPLGK